MAGEALGSLPVYRRGAAFCKQAAVTSQLETEEGKRAAWQQEGQQRCSGRGRKREGGALAAGS